MFIPYNLIISPSFIKKSEIGSIILSNPYYFSGHPRAEFDILLVFLIYERHKGPSSKWNPYFEAISDTELLNDWTDPELFQLQDPFLTYSAKESLETIEKTWNSLSEVFEANSEIFPLGMNLRTIFDWAYRVVMTRAFYHDELRLIPMADFINFANYEIGFENHDADVLATYAKTNEKVIDYKEFLGSSVHTQGSMDDNRYKNRLDEYLKLSPDKQFLKSINAIWEVERLLEDFESSDDEEEIFVVSRKQQIDESESDENDENPDDLIVGEDFVVLYTGAKNPVHKSSQIFQQIKKLSNRDLLLQYGFCLENNKFDSFYLLLWTGSFGKTGLVTVEEISQKSYKNEISSAEIGDVTELFVLKEDKLNIEIFKYFRKILDFSGFGLQSPSLKASPTDINVELVIIEKILELYTRIDEGKTPLSHDSNLLVRNLPKRMKYALIYRISQKRILNSQKNMLILLRSMLNKVKEGLDFNKHLTEKTIKSIKLVYPLRNYLKSLRGNLKYSKNS